MSLSHRRLRRLCVAATAVVAAGLLPACQADDGGSAGSQGGRTDVQHVSDEPVQISFNVEADAVVSVDTLVAVTAKGGNLDRVRLRSEQGTTLDGELEDGGTTWTASERLEPDTAYVVTSVARNGGGEKKKERRRFSTDALTLDQQVYPSVAPLEGETVGVGMPVIINFDLPVTRKKAVEKHLEVTSTPAQKGAWRWISDTEVHWRPKKYWKAGTEVSVEADLNSVPTGEGRYGQESRTVNFTVGDRHIYRVNARTHEMKVFSNGELVHTFPVTMGKAGFTTRSGVKLIMGKDRTRRMSSETIGIPQGSAEAYDIDNVEYAMRLTSTGEFIHAAPWSVGSQGVANVSHGCTGLSTANAGTLYAMTQRGDVTEFTGTDRQMTLDNGWGDWNVSFREWKQG